MPFRVSERFLKASSVQLVLWDQAAGRPAGRPCATRSCLQLFPNLIDLWNDMEMQTRNWLLRFRKTFASMNLLLVGFTIIVDRFAVRSKQ